MSRTLRISSLLLRSAPGLPQGLPSAILPGPGLTIIHGPNGSGKTTTARAAQALIWPEEADLNGWSVRGELDYDGDAWLVEIGPGLLTVQRAGQESRPPAGPGTDLADRYSLGLHQLIRADNQAFAEAVLRESTGGYDLKQALAKLGFEERLPRKGGKVHKAYESAQQKVHQSQRRQQELRGQEERLNRLLTRQERIKLDQAEMESLRNRLRWIEAKAAMKKAQAELANFPPAMENLTGRETERLEELRAKLEAEARGLDQERARRESSAQALSDLGLPADGIERFHLESLKNRLSQLEESEREQAGLQKDATEARAKLEQERANIGVPVAEERLDTLDLEGTRELAGLARQAEKVRAGSQAREALALWLGQERSRHDPEILRQGLNLLLDWTLEDGKKEALTPGLKRFLLLLCGVLIGSGALLGYRIHWGFWGMVLAGAGIWLWLALPRAQVRFRTEIQNRFLGLDLPGPESWTPEQVRRAARELWKYLGQEILVRERELKWSGLDREREALALEKAELDQERADIAGRLGIVPEMDESALFFLIESLRRLKDSRSELAGIEARLETVEGLRRELLEGLVSSMASHGYPDLVDRAGIKAGLSDLEGKAAEHKEISQELRHAEQKIDDAQARIQNLEAERLALFRDLGLDPGQEADLHRWVNNLPGFRAAGEEKLRAETEFQLAAQALGREAPPDPGQALELEQRLRECRASVEEFEPTLKEIGGLRARLEQARESHDLEEALAGLDLAGDRLREERDRLGRETLGALVGGYLEQRNRAESLPAVFNRADRFLNLFTKGGYSLDFDPAGPGFRAMETATGQGRSLDQLSSGTRVQLLMAVRMAFVEEREQGPRLPLFLDEALANSDPVRTRAILEAVCGILETGRQVFYLTARPSEVALWQELLQERGHDSLSVVDLEELKDQGRGQKRPLKSLPSPALPEPPGPDGLDREAYGKLLQVPEFDPAQEDLGQTHVWHFFQEPELIHRLLRAGYKHWGPLRTMLPKHALPFLPPQAPEAQRALAVARALEEVARGWRIGRGRPVQRRDLVEGGITPVFLDQVADLNRSLGRSARKLLEALENKEVKRFKKNSIAALEESLERSGCLDRRTVLSRQEILDQTMTGLAPELRDGHLTLPEIRALVDRLDLSD